jgi:chromosome segregation ATPase
MDRLAHQRALSRMQQQLEAEQRKTAALSALLRLTASAFLSAKHELRRVSEFHGDLVEEHALLTAEFAEQENQNNWLQSCMVDIQTQLARVCSDRTAAQEDVFQLQKQVKQQAETLAELQHVNEEQGATLAELRSWETCLKSDLATAQAALDTAHEACNKVSEQAMLLEQRLVAKGDHEFVKMVHSIHGATASAPNAVQRSSDACEEPVTSSSRFPRQKSVLEDAIAAQADVDGSCNTAADAHVVQRTTSAGSERRLSTIVKGVLKKLHSQEAGSGGKSVMPVSQPTKAPATDGSVWL